MGVVFRYNYHLCNPYLRFSQDGAKLTADKKVDKTLLIMIAEGLYPTVDGESSNQHQDRHASLRPHHCLLRGALP